MGELKNTITYLKGMADADAKKNREDILREMSDVDNWKWTDGDVFADRIRNQKAMEDTTEKAFEGLLALADQLDRIEKKLERIQIELDRMK